MELFGISEVLPLLIRHGYLLLFLLVFLDNAGVPLPGEPSLLAFGFVARTGHLDLGLGVMAASMGAMAGDNMSYWLGRLGGQRILRAYCRMTLGSGDCVSKAMAYYHRWGPVTVIVGRFIMGARAFLMPLAGSAQMPYGTFLLFDGPGALLWSSVYIVVGYALGNQVEMVSRQVRGGSALFGATLAIAFLTHLAMKLWKRHHAGAA